MLGTQPCEARTPQAPPRGTSPPAPRELRAAGGQGRAVAAGGGRRSGAAPEPLGGAPRVGAALPRISPASYRAWRGRTELGKHGRAGPCCLRAAGGGERLREGAGLDGGGGWG